MIDAPAEDAAAVDGRTARRDRNRQSVLDAILEIFSENIDPTPDIVALRSGVSPRSVYRYFEDRDELLRAAIARKIETVWPLFTITDLGAGHFDVRLDVFVASRVRLFLEVADTARAARHRADRVPAIAAQIAETQRALRDQLERHFAPEISELPADCATTTVRAADVASQFESLEYLRQQNIDAQGICDILRVTLTALFRPPSTVVG